jgi:hypothetical protein
MGTPFSSTTCPLFIREIQLADVTFGNRSFRYSRMFCPELQEILRQLGPTPSIVGRGIFIGFMILPQIKARRLHTRYGIPQKNCLYIFPFE